VQVPKTNQGKALIRFAVTYPHLFNFFNHSIMRNGEGQKNCPHGSNAEAQSAPKTPQMLSPGQVQLLDYADALDGPHLVKSLKLLHDIAVYHSTEPIDEEEKDALYHIKVLWECIEVIVGEG
jgi:hypothetical protein